MIYLQKRGEINQNHSEARCRIAGCFDEDKTAHNSQLILVVQRHCPTKDILCHCHFFQ